MILLCSLCLFFAMEFKTVLQDLAFLSSRATFAPHFIKIVVEFPTSEPPHVLKLVVAWVWSFEKIYIQQILFYGGKILWS